MGRCAAAAPWRVLCEMSCQHGWFGLTVGLLLLWTMRARVGKALDLHLAGSFIANALGALAYA